MKFKAFIDGVHFDPKKGTVKISLVATSHDVSLDELTTLSPKDESIHVTLESEQTKLKYEPKPGNAITIDEETAGKLKEAADRLEEGNLAGSPLEERAPEKRPYHDPDDIPLDGVPVDEEDKGG